MNEESFVNPFRFTCIVRVLAGPGVLSFTKLRTSRVREPLPSPRWVTASRTRAISFGFDGRTIFHSGLWSFGSELRKREPHCLELRSSFESNASFAVVLYPYRLHNFSTKIPVFKGQANKQIDTWYVIRARNFVYTRISRPRTTSV